MMICRPLASVQPRYGGIDMKRAIQELLNKHPELNIDHKDYNINVAAAGGTFVAAEQALQIICNHRGFARPTHLYFHIPLCNYICHFCNYVKTLLPKGARAHEVKEQWFKALLTESKIYLDMAPWIHDALIESTYFGGGTAAALEISQLERLVQHIRENYTLSRTVEMSLEGNPDNFTLERLESYLNIGFNRFSLGVQSLQEKVNQFVGRKHSPSDSLLSIKALKTTQLPFNVDMMFGLPYQTVDAVENDIRTLCELEVPTITIYRLRNVDRSALGIGSKSRWNNPREVAKLESDGVFPPLTLTYEMRERIVGVFKQFKYRPSPCGWWSRPGTYSNGNIPRVSENKWQRYHSMIAYGPGAYGWYRDGARTLQTHNTADIHQYLSMLTTEHKAPLASGRILQGKQALAAALGFAFKAAQPIEIKRFQKEFGVDLLVDPTVSEVIQELIDYGFLQLQKDQAALHVTEDGESLHEEIIAVYIHGKITGQKQQTCQRIGLKHAS